MEHQANRRDLLLISLMAALPLGVTGAVASPLNPEQTIIKPPAPSTMRATRFANWNMRAPSRSRRDSHINGDSFG